MTVDMVNHPPHYSSHPSGIECIDITREMTFDAGNAVKYIFRADLKNGRQDVEKARWYLRDALEHGGQVYAGVTPWQWNARMNVVIRHETDPNRIQFFSAVRVHDLVGALTAVRDMLTTQLADQDQEPANDRHR